MSWGHTGGTSRLDDRERFPQELISELRKCGEHFSATGRATLTQYFWASRGQKKPILELHTFSWKHCSQQVPFLKLLSPKWQQVMTKSRTSQTTNSIWPIVLKSRMPLSHTTIAFQVLREKIFSQFMDKWLRLRNHCLDSTMAGRYYTVSQGKKGRGGGS